MADPTSIDRLVAESERLRGRMTEMARDLEFFSIQLQEASRDLAEQVRRRESGGDCHGAGDAGH